MGAEKHRLPKGVITAILTPMNSDLSVDLDLLNLHARWLLSRGNDGIALMGTTGEANSLSLGERKDILDSVITGGIEPHRLLVGTGCCSLPETIDLTRHAVDHGVGGVLMLPPFYYKNVTDEALFSYFKMLINGVGDTSLHIYLYHFPLVSQTPFSHGLIERLLLNFPDHIVGMKDSSGDLKNMLTLTKRFSDFRVYAGTEKYLLNMLNAGGGGCISATTNILSPLASKVFEAWKNGNTDAVTLQERLTAMRTSLDGHSFVAVLKALLAQWHANDQWTNLRPPNGPVSDEIIRELDEKLQVLGLAEFGL